MVRHLLSSARQETANTQVLPEIAQPKPFEGYRRQPQPAVSRVRYFFELPIRAAQHY